MSKETIVQNKKKQRAAVAILVTAAMIILTAAAASADGNGGLVSSLLLSLGMGAFVYWDVKLGKAGSAVLCLAAPAAALWALENYTHVLSDLTPMILALNLLFFYLLYGVLLFLCGSVRWGGAIATLIPMVFGLVNYFVVSFRGSPIVPWDLLSIGTAVSVADNYSFELSWKVLNSIFVFVWLILLASKSSVRFTHRKPRIAFALVFTLLLGGYVSGIQKPEVQSFFGMDTTLFTLNVLYRNNGIAAAFLGNLRFLNIEEPDGYSAKKAEELMQQVEDEDSADTGNKTEVPSDVTQYPNIIVIMNEAFSDLSVYGDFATSEEVMPFFKSLQDEAVGGEVYVSVKGGNTANTEFEFLTGNTMGFLPTGSVPYQQYINEPTPSLASYLKQLGYGTTAIHPYNRSGWDRDTVYEHFGFDEFLDKEAFYEPERLREYVSDRAAYNKIIEQFEIKGAEERKFIFEVTMQNHGGYSKDSPGFDIYLTLPEVKGKATNVIATEKYLTLMNQSDRALEELITYFKQKEEPVVVLMFGDHQPSDYITHVIQKICGVPEAETLEEIQTGYRVPFMIWSNYGLEHQYYDGISVNYLSGLLLENAGVPLTGYQKFLRGLMDEIPVVTGLVYRDADGKFHSYEEDAQPERLNDYRMLQYNQLVDKANRNTAFFGG